MNAGWTPATLAPTHPGHYLVWLDGRCFDALYLPAARLWYSCADGGREVKPTHWREMPEGPSGVERVSDAAVASYIAPAPYHGI